MKRHPLDLLTQAHTEQQLSDLQNAVYTEGFSGFYRLLEGFTERLKTSSDKDMLEIQDLIAKAKKLFPDPVKFSPSWEQIWQELEDIAATKIRIFHTIAPDQREGEWQVVMDNPNMTQDVVCYPALSFMEGAYLYAYFHPRMVASEYLRLQKIQTLIMEFGS
jgi:hypothetical protein